MLYQQLRLQCFSFLQTLEFIDISSIGSLAFILLGALVFPVFLHLDILRGHCLALC